MDVFSTVSVEGFGHAFNIQGYVEGIFLPAACQRRVYGIKYLHIYIYSTSYIDILSNRIHLGAVLIHWKCSLATLDHQKAGSFILPLK